MAEADLVLRHASLLTLAGPSGPRGAEAADGCILLEDHAVAVRGGRITWVGPDPEWMAGADRNGDAKRVLDAEGGLVTPGFVDPHTHLVYAGDRAFEIGMRLRGHPYLEILAAGGGIAYTTRQTRAASVQDLMDQTRPRLQRMRRNGTTALEAKSGYALETAGELRMLEAADRLAREADLPMHHTFLGAHAVPVEYKGDVDGYVDRVVEEMLPAVAEQGIAQSCDVFVEEGVFTVEQGEHILEAAKRHGLWPRLHADEIVCTHGAELAARCGAVSADHLLRVAPEGITAMADAGTVATLLPTVPITLMQPEWAPGKAFLEAGVPVALASDHNPNNPVTDMNLVTQLGCFLLGLTPAQAWTAATWNAACTLGMEEDLGSIEVGKRADLLLHDVPDLEHWAMEPGRRTVRAVVSGGRLQDRA